LRRSSFSNSFTRLLATFSLRLSTAVAGPAGAASALSSAPAAAARHARNCSSCSPSRRSNSPSAVPDSPSASATTRSLSAPVHFFGDSAGGLDSLGAFIAPTLPASRNRLDNVGCDTPTCFANVCALAPDGPTIFLTICALKASVYGTSPLSFHAPSVVLPTVRSRRQLR